MTNLHRVTGHNGIGGILSITASHLGAWLLSITWGFTVGAAAKEQSNQLSVRV